MAAYTIAPDGYPSEDRLPGQDRTSTPEPQPGGIDYDTPLGTVRLLIPDTSDAPLLEDVQLLRLLRLEGVGPQTAKAADDEGVHTRSCTLAAANALDVIAASEALVGKAIRTQDLSTDGPKVAASLRARASDMRARVEAEDNAEIGDLFEHVPYGRY